MNESSKIPSDLFEGPMAYHLIYLSLVQCRQGLEEVTLVASIIQYFCNVNKQTKKGFTAKLANSFIYLFIYFAVE